MVALIAFTFAEDVQVLNEVRDVRTDGFDYSYELSNGIAVKQSGTGVNIKGNYKYTAPDGTPIEMSYVADENGYQPSGDLIQAIPPLIARALEYIRTHPPKE